MKPLVSPIAEFRLLGVVLLIGGFALTVVAIDVQGVVAALVAVVVGASIFGGFMYVSAYRPLVRRAVEAPASAPTDGRESGRVTTRRILVLTGPVLVAVLLVAVVTGMPGSVAGIVVGSGAAAWLTSRWLRRWEGQTGQRLLREPRWSWGSRDCYVVPHG